MARQPIKPPQMPMPAASTAAAEAEVEVVSDEMKSLEAALEADDEEALALDKIKPSASHPVTAKKVSAFKQMVAKLPAGPLNVVATMPGIYANDRKSEGDKFTIKGKHEFGSWMKLI